jgi:hypothetical protein
MNAAKAAWLGGRPPLANRGGRWLGAMGAGASRTGGETTRCWFLLYLVDRLLDRFPEAVDEVDEVDEEDEEEEEVEEVEEVAEVAAP